MKIYVAVVKAFRKFENKVKTQFIIEIDRLLSASHPPPKLNVNVFFLRFSFNLTLFMTKLSVLMLYIFYFTNKSTIYLLYTFNDHTFLQLHIN